MQLHCINSILFQKDCLAPNYHRCVCREDRIASFGHNGAKLDNQELQPRPRLRADLRESPWENCWRPERFALKGSGVQAAQWQWKCYCLQIWKDLHGFLTFTMVFNVLMRMVQLLRVLKLKADFPGLYWLRMRVVIPHLVAPKDKHANMRTNCSSVGCY